MEMNPTSLYSNKSQVHFNIIRQHVSHAVYVAQIRDI